MKKRHIESIESLIITNGWETGKDKKSGAFGARMFPEAIGLENVDRRDYHLATLLEEGFEGIRDMEVPSTGRKEAPSPLKTFRIRVRDGLPFILDRL